MPTSLITAIEELRDAALVGMGGNRIVRNADGYPNGAFLRLCPVWAATHHLKHPSLVFVGYGESLTLGVIAVLLYE